MSSLYAKRPAREQVVTSIDTRGVLEFEGPGGMKVKTEGTILPYVALGCFTLIALAIVYGKYWHHGLMRKIKRKRG